MTSVDRIFSLASEEALVELISYAQRRIVVVAPALTTSVATAILRQLESLGQLDVTVILDSDPEVYRIGFGDVEALELVRKACANQCFHLREQLGVRIGVLISDDTTMVYSPVPKSIEVGSVSIEKPNAIVLSGSTAGCIATAAGANEGSDMQEPEIGEKALEVTNLQEMQSNLKDNPPTPFDVTRKLNVFSSKVQYVEFSVTNYRFTTRHIPLPSDLLDVSDENLKDRITSRIRAPFDGIGKLEIVLDQEEAQETLQIDEAWLKNERKRIEDEYTFQINNFGRVILYRDRERFDQAAERFRVIVEKYQTALKEALTKSQDEFEQRIVDEFSLRWKQNPPRYFRRWDIEPTHENICMALQKHAQEIFEGAISFNPPVVKILYKNVAPENLQDHGFLDALKTIMLKRRVPHSIVDSLFESGQAAPETGRFLDR